MIFSESKPMRKIDFQVGGVFYYCSEKMKKKTQSLMIVQVNREEGWFTTVPLDDIPYFNDLKKSFEKVNRNEIIEKITIEGMSFQVESPQFWKIPNNTRDFTIEDFFVQPWEKEHSECELFLEYNHLPNYHFFDQVNVFSVEYQIQDEQFKTRVYFTKEFNSSFYNKLDKFKKEQKILSKKS